VSAIGVIVLAAGGSTRMGQPKQLLPFRGTTLLRHAAQTALATGFAPVVVVLGAVAEQCCEQLEGLPVETIVNERWEEGMGGSIGAGTAFLQKRAPQTKAALVMLHDQPLITAERLRELTSAWRPPEIKVAASAYSGTVGVPAVFDRDLFPELAALRGKAGAQKIIRTHGDRLATVPMPEAETDVDTPGDLERLA
jgi:CTP:molybdopterin cytidylyltransferase MocA